MDKNEETKTATGHAPCPICGGRTEGCGTVAHPAPEQPNPATGHTPGPWEVSTIEGEDVLMVGGGEDGSAIVADVRTGWNGLGMDEANARLIASAPEMLAALKELLDQLEGIGIPEWSGAEGLCLTQARAAIAKAEGGAS